jgi:DNA-binding transcriptional MerR regulator
MGSHQPIRKIVTPEIPDKLYFRIGDVAKLCDVPAYVLRFWETEFPQLKPNKGGTGQRLYRKRDVEMALRIKSLLYDQGYTIPGARQVFKTDAKSPESNAAEPVLEPRPVEVRPPVSGTHRENQLQSLRNEMNALLGMLSRPTTSFATTPTPAAPGKVKAMRPRLVLEPKPTPVAVERPRLQLEQRDLFSIDFTAEPEPAE